MVDHGAGTSMKQTFHSCLLLFFYLSLVTSSLPLLHNFLPPKQGEEEMKVDNIETHGISPKNVESNPLANNNNLIGMEMEECDNHEDQECFNMRSIPHLDYIYTQQHDNP